MGFDKLIAKVLQLSADPLEWAKLQEALQSEEKHIEKQKAHTAQALKALDPEQHSLGYLYLLDANGGVAAASLEFIQHAARFVRACSRPQISLAPRKFATLCHKLKEQAVQLECPKQAIAPLLEAIGKLAPSAEFITPIHAHLFQVCLLAKCYNAAIPALAEEAFEVDPSVTGMTATDFLLYCYYGARIHIGRKRYEAALQLLLQALTAPTAVVNAITVAAYKKYVLVSLIHLGHVPLLPKHTASSVTRLTKTECERYTEIVRAYGKSDFDAAPYAEEIEIDGNTGLLHLALEARTKRAIQRLTQTYLTLSLDHIAASVGLPSGQEAELYILRMIDAQDIFAEIDDSQGMVRFLEDPEEYNTPAAAANLDSAIERAMHLAAKVQAINHAVSCDKALLSKMEGREKGPRVGFVEEMETEEATGHLPM